MAKKRKKSTSKPKPGDWNYRGVKWKKAPLSAEQVDVLVRDMDAMARSLKDVSNKMRGGGIESVTLTWQPLTDEFAVIRGIVKKISGAVDAAVGHAALMDQLGLRQQKS